MTIAEKRQKVTRYCEMNDCKECVLYDGEWEHEFGLRGLHTCLNIADANEAELDKALELISRNPYWHRITQLADRQRAKGVAAYGQGLEDNLKPDAIERIEYIQEELIDGLMYLEWLKEKLKGEMKNATEKED